MKSIITIFTTLFMFNLQASVESCVEQFSKFGDGNGNDKISMNCYNLFKTNATSSVQYKDETKNIFGYKNLIVFESLDKDGNIIKKEIIAGSSTLLNSVVSIGLDEANNEIAVLDENGDVLFFSTVLMGNIAPFRVLRNQVIHGSNIIIVNSTLNEVYIYKKESAQVLVFSRNANFYGREGRKQLNVIRDYTDLPTSTNKLSLDEKSEILLIFKDETQLHSINLKTK